MEGKDMLLDIQWNKACQKAKAWMLFEEIINCLRINNPLPEYCREAVEHIATCENCAYYFNLFKSRPELLETAWGRVVMKNAILKDNQC
jgi:hypothetical protein